MRKKDVVLMATVTSFESIPYPSRSELRQFAELFAPLFSASSEEARRAAVAALSQCGGVPPAVAYFIASQPITVAAPFLAASKCLTDDALIAIARTQGEAHARAIVRREALSPTVIDALVGLRHDRTMRPSARPSDHPMVDRDNAQAAEAAVAEPILQRRPPPAMMDAAMVDEAERVTREEQLRRRLKALAGHVDRPANDRLGLRNLSPIQEALLVRFARNRETGLFATVLADTLSASRWLSERIMLDISGQQLATTLKGLAMNDEDALFILQRLYDHLAFARDGVSRAETLWTSLDEDDCGKRVEAWRRADSYTYAETRRPAAGEERAAESGEESRDDLPKVIRTTATARRPAPSLRRAR